MNDREAARSAGFDPDAFDYRKEERIREATKILYERWKTPVFVTRGDRGSLVFDGAGFQAVPGFHVIDKIDTVGAGDSMFAGIAAGLAAGLSPEQALFLPPWWRASPSGSCFKREPPRRRKSAFWRETMIFV